MKPDWSGLHGSIWRLSSSKHLQLIDRNFAGKQSLKRVQYQRPYKPSPGCSAKTLVWRSSPGVASQPANDTRGGFVWDWNYARCLCEPRLGPLSKERKRARETTWPKKIFSRINMTQRRIPSSTRAVSKLFQRKRRNQSQKLGLIQFSIFQPGTSIVLLHF